MSDWTNSIQTGDCFDVLGELPESSVHMCMTSPPYYGLRDYDVDGQIGLEETLDEYIDRLVRVGDDLQRVLRDDGSWWLNLGDTYAGTGTAQPEGSYKETVESPEPVGQSLGRKNKMLVPHRVAIALQGSGWVVRNDATWVKPNPMPSSVKDRLNTTTEQIFHLTPAADYWYDLDAIREPYDKSTVRRQDYKQTGRVDKGGVEPGDHDRGGIHDGDRERRDMMHPAGKNPGDVFEVTTKPFPGAHFAVYPPELCDKPIKATCPPKVCAACGAPYERETEKTGEFTTTQGGDRTTPEMTQHGRGGNTPDGKVGTQVREFKGWQQTCGCDTDATESGICLDPFAGAGTTLLKAKELGRRFVGIELNPEYADMARARIGLTPEDPARVRDDDDQQGLEAFADGGGR